MTEYKCGSAKQCQFGEMCKPSYDIGGCNHFKQKKPQTNEEYIKSLNTEQLVKVFGSMLFEAWKDGLAEEMHDKRFYENLVDFWLKQPHTPIS